MADILPAHYTHTQAEAQQASKNRKDSACFSDTSPEGRGLSILVSPSGGWGSQADGSLGHQEEAGLLGKDVGKL